ncbi:DUF1330 domain-containing protein [Vibrio sp. D420a]|uniref:DUF1330 domain-containing protein n=1 Tax=Vibrio sp. D420a TaxID=2836895 RepID=UPI00255761B8|nr:DUF1330 domain-containing protein [Vibrio sp. D420a]MDK9764689.1 DUF1330 domain-containing protein [Vibrio sp. D420a]
MTVLFIAQTRVKDIDKLQEYISAAGPIMKTFGAEVLLRGKHLDTLLGDKQSDHITGIFRFPNEDSVKSFLACDAYKDLLSVRNQAGEMNFNLYQE